MKPKKLGTILFVMDERLSREKATLLARTIHTLRQIADVQLLAGHIDEDSLVKKLEEQTPQLVLAPWYRYLNWSRVEAFYGLTRTSGPTFAGYFCDRVEGFELGGEADHLRTILLDFGGMTAGETTVLVRALMKDTQRSGILPLLAAGTPVYCENWYSGQGLGLRMDAVLGLPEIANQEWAHRVNSIRIAMTSLWSLIYDEGPGKSEFHQQITINSPKAYFQVAADRRCLVLRLCYSMPTWSPKEAVSVFWPRQENPTHPAQLLLRFADFVRVHRITETTDVEVVAGFFNSAVADRAPNQLHSIWIEPITAKLVTEIPYEAPSPSTPHLKPLPTIALNDPKLRSEHGEKARERFIVEAAVKIRELKTALSDRDQLIKELKSGGVGTSAPLPPPDAETLLEAFQERFFDARFQIRQFELQIAEMERSGATQQEVEALRVKMNVMAQRLQSWIAKLGATIESFREAKKKPGDGTTGAGTGG